MLAEKVVIGVVPRDRFSMFRQCLEALYSHTDVPFRIVVVSGGTDIETKQYLQKLANQKKNLTIVLADRLLMQGEARNLAMRQIKERFVVLLENDTIMHKNWLGPLLDCIRQERAAVVAPLILDFWNRDIHAAGGIFEEPMIDGTVEFHNRVMHAGMKALSVKLERMKIDYPETHCVLIDRLLVRGNDLFDDVEPFDADLGLTLRKQGLSILLEPCSVGTYLAPPRFEVSDIAAFKFRWDAVAWAVRNRRFMQKWKVSYDATPKKISYRRQLLKLGPAYWYPNKFTVFMLNAYLPYLKRLRNALEKGT